MVKYCFRISIFSKIHLSKILNDKNTILCFKNKYCIKIGILRIIRYKTGGKNMEGKNQKNILKEGKRNIYSLHLRI